MLEKIYCKITENKKNMFIFILLLTLLSSIPVFIFPGIKKGDDVYFHLSRICALSDNIKSFRFSGVYPGYFNDYGYANGLFYPDIFLYFPALLKSIGLSEILSYKIFLVFINFFSILFIYICIKGISKSKYAGILGSIIYAFASYRLVDMYERAALGEVLAFVFAPLVIYGIYEVIYGNYKKFYILVLGMTGLILSHIVSTYMIGLVLFFMCLINIKRLFRERRILYLLLAGVVTFLLTSYFLLPMLEQMLSQVFYYSNTSNISEFELSKRTVPLYLLFLEVPNLRKAIFHKYWVPSGIGIIFVYFLYLKIKHRKISDNFVNCCYLIGIVTLILTVLTPFWKLGIVKKVLYPIQFPWRFYFVVTVLFTVGGCLLVSKVKDSKKLLRNTFIISFISLISMFVIAIIPKRILEVVDYDASYAEYLPKEVDRDYIKKRGIVVTSNNDVFCEFKKNGTEMEITFVNNYDNTYLELPLIYYKGYSASDGYELFKTENGLLGIRLNDIREGTIFVSYRGTRLACVTRFVSFITFVLFMIYVGKEVTHEK